MITSVQHANHDFISGRLFAPHNRFRLRQWLHAYTGLRLPDHAVCPNHHSPLDYLAYVFFEDSLPAPHAPGVLASACTASPPRSPAGDVVIWACRGGGKTTIGAAATLLDLLFKPGIQVRILGGSREQSRRMYVCLTSLISNQFSDQLAGPIRNSGFSLTNGSRVEILAQSARSVRGTRVQKLRCDELELFDRDVWHAAQLTTRSLPASPGSENRRVRGTLEAFSTMHVVGGLMHDLLNPADPARASRKIFNWCIWDVMEPCDPNIDCHTCPLFPDCGGRAKQADGFVPLEDVLAMHQRSSKKSWETEMLCFRPYFEDRVFAAFSPAAHVRAADLTRGQPPLGHTLSDGPRSLTLEALIAGVDFGYLNFVCLWIAMLRDRLGRRIVWVLDELLSEHSSLARNLDALGNHPVGGPDGLRNGRFWRPSTLYCDDAGRQHDSHSGITSLALMRKAGFHVRSRSMGVQDGIGFINELLDPAWTDGRAPILGPRLLIDPRCPRLIRALESYRRKKDGSPHKDGAHDHFIDALRYALLNHDRRGSKVEIITY